MTAQPIRCAIVGYGLVQTHGARHAAYIGQVPDLRLTAICDRNADRREAARADYPDVPVFASVDELLAEGAVDLVSIVTPNHTHVPLARQCLAAGKHVVVDKPLCFTLAEADDLFARARQADRLVTVFLNRRRDGNYLTIQRLVRDGTIGDVFEARFTHVWPRLHQIPWRNNKETSGGALYYAFGPHVVDWILKLVPGPVASVTAFYQKLIWPEITNEDHIRVLIRFASGAVGDITISNVQVASDYFWRISGTRGAILDTGTGALTGYRPPFPAVAPAPGTLRLLQQPQRAGEVGESEVPYDDSAWGLYYADVANHLLRGGPPPISEVDARRVVAVTEAAERSAISGTSEPVDGE